MALGDQTDPILIKQGDTRPRVRARAWQGTTATPIPLTGATVVFNARLSTNPGTVIVNRQTATVIDGANGIMEYGFTAAQTQTTAGLYQTEFEVTLTDGSILTLPTGDNYIWVRIGDDIA